MNQHKYYLTQGGLIQEIARYSVHPNGQRALIRRIQALADQTGQETWAESELDLNRWQQYREKQPNRLYPRKPFGGVS